MLRNPGCPVTIYDVGALIGQAFEKSMTPSNITQAFKETEIFPLDRHIFSDEDFAPSTVTDRPENPQLVIDPSIENEGTDHQPILELEEEPLLLQVTYSPRPSTSTAKEPFREKSFYRSDILTHSLDGSAIQNVVIILASASESDANQSTKKSLITPDQFRKPLKAPTRLGKRKPRKLGKSHIATDTPAKNAIAEQKAAKRKKETKSKGMGKKVIRQVLQSDSEDEEDMVLNDETDDEGGWVESLETIITEDLLKKSIERLPNE
ncbi:hypothetical protein HF086_001155, partial [Spodoptera exigua]